MTNRNLHRTRELHEAVHVIAEDTWIQYDTSVLETEHKLETVLLGVRVPMRPIPVAGIVRLVLNFASRNPECNGLIRLSSDLWLQSISGGDHRAQANL